MKSFLSGLSSVFNRVSPTKRKSRARQNHQRRVFLEPLERRNLLASDFELLADINALPGGISSDPQDYTLVGSNIFFSAATPTSGRELWKTDGTAEGTLLVKDIYAGMSGSTPRNLMEVDGVLFFVADDISGPNRLWKSDGTEAGTVVVHSELQVWNNFSAGVMENVNGTLFIAASHASNNGTGVELWKSDGTEAGTVLVKDFIGVQGSYPYELTSSNGVLFLNAYGDGGRELWKSDGTEAGTVQVKDIYVGGHSSPQHLRDVNGALFFVADNGPQGRELWKSDGTEAGTVLVRNILTGTDGPDPQHLTNVNGTLYFTAVDASNGRELWKSDGTLAGTVLVKNIRPNGAYEFGSYPQDLVNVGGTLFFTANDGANGVELWKSNGTNATTVMVKDTYTGASSSYPSNLTNVNGTLAFVASDPSVPFRALMKSDGSAVGTVLVDSTFEIDVDHHQYPTSLAAVGDDLYFAAPSLALWDVELWKSDLTEAGTVKIKELASATWDSLISEYIELGDELIFTANDGSGSRIWISDGSAAGTSVLTMNVSWINTPSFTRSGEFVFFAGYTPEQGLELWKTDGTEAGTMLVKDIAADSGWSVPSNLTDVNGTLFFSANNGTQGYELWKSDGTADGTVLVRNILTGADSSSPQNLTNVDGILYFSAYTISNGRELWKSDGTSAGTVLVRNISAGDASSDPQSFTSLGGSLFFVAYDAISGWELWKSDGTSASTVRLSDANIDSLSPTASTSELVFFVAPDPTYGYQVVWKSDGTTAGTVPVNPSFDNVGDHYFPSQLTVVGDTVYFTAYGWTSGRNELWKTDGTEEGTLLVKDIHPTVSTFPTNLRNVDGKLYFTANDGVHGEELWTTDGTEAGTTLVWDFQAQGGSNPAGLVEAGDYYYALVTTEQFGREFFVQMKNLPPTDLSLSNQSIAENEDVDAAVGAFIPVDPNPNDTFTYSLVTGEGSDDNASFAIVGGVLQSAEAFDFEIKENYSIRVRVTDDGGLYFENVFSITVSNVNESPLDLLLSNSVIAENEPIGTTIGDLSTIDPDAGDSFTYSLVDGTGAEDNANFVIENGVLKANASFDYETKSSYSIRVRSLDAGDLFAEKIFIIQVSDVGENSNAAPVIGGVSTALPLTYKENALPILVASAATVTDADSPNFDSGTLTATLGATATSSDQLTVKNVGVNANQISVNNGVIIFTKKINNVLTPIEIGSFTGGEGLVDLVITFNASATKTEVQAAIRAITFKVDSETPSAAPRLLSLTLTDGDGGTSIPATRTINVTPVNDAPVLVTSGLPVQFTENDAPIIIDGGVTITDVDSADFDTGKLTVKIVGGQTSDLIGIETTSGPFSINATTKEVFYEGGLIGIYAGTTTFTVTFNAAATPAIVQELAQRITFWNASDAVNTSIRTISFSVADGDKGASLAAALDSVEVTAVNDEPMLTNITGLAPAKFTENGVAVAVASSGLVVDPDLWDFEGGTLTASLGATGELADLLAIKSALVPTANQLNLVGNAVYYSKLVNNVLSNYQIGTFTGGQALTDLVISFNASANKTEVQAALRAILFSNSSENPSTSQRSVSFILTDGDGGESAPATRLVNVIAKVDPPTVANFGGDVNWTVNDPSGVLLTDSVEVGDVDSADFLGGKLVVALTTNKQSLDRIEILEGDGITIDSINKTVSYNGALLGSYAGTTSLTVTFTTANADALAVEALLKRISFRSTSTSTLTRTVSVTVNDGDLGTSAAVTKLINVSN
jgi:ELWxxDGT repeat protein